MKDWIYDYLKEMIEKRMNIEFTDVISDIVSEYSQDIADGVHEGYYCSSIHVADCNLKENIKSEDKREIEKLKEELTALYQAISVKGYSFYYSGTQVHETGMEHVGGTVLGSYDKIVK